MSQEMVAHRRNNGRWIGIGIALAVIGLASVITSLILGNTWNEDGGTGHGALQGRF